jgi:hypothetical protein
MVPILRAGIVIEAGLLALLLTGLGTVCFLERPNDEAYGG